MQSFVKAAVAIAFLSGGSFALPTQTNTVNRRENDFFFPIWIPPAPANGPIYASGANGGYNYGGSGANGGSISISRRETESKQKDNTFFPLFLGWNQPPPNGAITAVGANGGTNIYGDGANGGSISINKRKDDFLFPIWFPPRPTVNGPITASGANGGYNYNGDGANGGSISINKRGEDFFFPIWLPPPPPANGPITANGANGGFNYNGNGANGGSISIGKRETESENKDGILFPLFWWNQPPANGAITAEGANGGTNINGNGANGGRISIG
ncbi:hypothetical protein JR316_0010820 [Psilocybe cubensis]|uniref:Uncharacterized protein n=2 Tax=Psilocybe cubensis TaxID=181762 RepID=A0A8H8CK63_PSICU|nr:hypothetical protein JR316_0010820 [Psilocybe cubensis]KAH9476904.1 hypothetical protein JR316_0010820 [Psilocybe cubensis]